MEIHKYVTYTFFGKQNKVIESSSVMREMYKRTIIRIRI